MNLFLSILLTVLLAFAILVFAAPLGALAIVPWIATLVLGSRLVSKFATISEV